MKKEKISPREAHLETVFAAFDKGVENFAKMSNAESFETKPLFVKRKRGKQEMLARLGRVCFESCVILFKYSFSGSLLSGVAGGLECLVAFGREKSEIPYPMNRVLMLAEPSNFECFSFCAVANSEIMQDCMEQLSGSLLKLLKRLEAFSKEEKEFLYKELVAEVAKQNQMDDDSSYEILSVRYNDKMENALVVDAMMHYEDGRERETVEDELYYAFASLEAVGPAFFAYLKGNCKESLSWLKDKNASEYQKRFTERVKRCKAGTVPPPKIPDSLAAALKEFNASGQKKMRLREGLILALTALAAGAIFSVIFYFLTGIIIKGDAKNTIFFACESPGLAILIGMIAGLFACVCIYEVILKLFKMKLQLQISYLTWGGTGGGWKAGALVTVISLCIFVVFFLTSKTNIQFYENEFVDNTAFFSLSGTTHSYDEISSIKAGEEEEGYSIFLKDESEIYLPGYVLNEEDESNLLLFLESKINAD